VRIVAVIGIVCLILVPSSTFQRFKRAKTFFKLARKWFTIETIPAGLVVDYDVLSWGDRAHVPSAHVPSSSVPAAAASSETASLSPRVIDSGSADYSRYCATSTAGESDTGHRVPGGSSEAAASASATAPVWHAVDSDSDPDEDKAAAHLSGFTTEGGGLNGAAAVAAAGKGGRPVLGAPQPLKAYVYVLTRKPAPAAHTSKAASRK
jgi:hypothetical protein